MCLLSAHAETERKITIQGLFNNTAVVTIDGSRHILKVGGSPVDGVVLISANSKEAVIEIDGQQDTYKLGQHIGTTFKKPPPGKIVTIAPDAGGHYEVNGNINGFQVKFLVDTGATRVTMNRSEAKRLGINYKLDGKQGFSQTASGTIKSYTVDLETVMVGSIKLRNIKGGVIASDDSPPIILLGNAFLDRVNIVREGRLMKLKER